MTTKLEGKDVETRRLELAYELVTKNFSIDSFGEEIYEKEWRLATPAMYKQAYLEMARYIAEVQEALNPDLPEDSE